MNFSRSGAMAVAAMLLSVEIVRTADAQVYAPPPAGGYGVPPQAPSAVEGTGNPFLRRGPSRTAQPPMRFDDRVAPAAFEQPLPNSPSQPIAPMPVAAPVAVPQPFVPPPTAAPLMPPQQLHGLALLTAGSADPLAAQNEHPLLPVLRWADDTLQQMQGLGDYTCTFTKRERVDGRLQEQQVMYAKVRQAPYSVYLQFLAPSDVKGQEAMYVEGRNQGKLLAHPVGMAQMLVGTLSLAPNDPKAMEGNRYPITDFGVRRLVERYREALAYESQFGEVNVRVVPGAQVADRPCTCIEVSHPVRRSEFRYHLTRLYVDNELNLPTHYESYDWPTQPGQPPQLIEDYTYQGLRPNVGLSDADFDVKNPNYRF